MSEPTAQDRATAMAEVEHFPILYFHCPRCRSYNCHRERAGMAEEINLTVEKVASIIARERARILALVEIETQRPHPRLGFLCQDCGDGALDDVREAVGLPKNPVLPA